MKNKNTNKSQLELKICKDLGEKIIEYRTKKPKLTREKFLTELDKADLSFSIGEEALKSYERGERECPVSKFFIIAMSLNMDLNEIRDSIAKEYEIPVIKK